MDYHGRPGAAYGPAGFQNSTTGEMIPPGPSVQEASKVVENASQTYKIELTKEVSEKLAKMAEEQGYYTMAATLRGEAKPKQGIFKRTMDAPLQVKYALVAVGVAFGIWIIYEGIAFLVDKTWQIHLPSALRSEPGV